ncbi:flippase [uncultured Parabacteroides sp.]|uniref:flippase n=1 Tax=uncultured Parabacteroides sp. TaxID=512312 RepID=UPI002621EC54|nr:flippase [uncultured Parabacteroides sp.]
MSTLKTNIILNFINTVTGIIFPVITFPYAARVLLPEGIGSVNFLQSIVAYIVLLTSLGIPMYAVREVAKYRDDIVIRNRITVEILLLSVILCLFGYVVVAVLGVYVPQISAQLGVFYALSLTILFTSLGVNWFYQAIEDFKFITIRALCFRLLATLALFLFVKGKEDLLIYAFVLVGTTVGNNLINFIHLRKWMLVRSICWDELHIWRHLRPSLRIFVFNLVTSIYLNLNTVMLGFMRGDDAVGFYTAGNKLSHVVLSVVASLGVVLLPRCSNLIETGQMEAFSKVTSKSYRLVVGVSLPSIVGLIVLAIPVIRIFCGDEFLEAVPVLCWTAPVILFIGLSNVIGLQILYPLGKESIVIWSTVGGAVLNLLLNLWLIPPYGAVGAAISTFGAEFIVLFIQVVVGCKYLPFRFYERDYLNYLWASGAMAMILYGQTLWISNTFYLVSSCVMTGVLVYAGILWIKRDVLFMEVFSYATKLIKK